MIQSEIWDDFWELPFAQSSYPSQCTVGITQSNFALLSGFSYIALTMFSVTFLASPSSIMVLSR
jgi:hypothetical protein